MLPYRQLASLLLVVLLGSFPVQAARRTHRVFDQDTGLTGSLVQAMGQDSDGYLWLATIGGVVRFDGVRFRTWSDRPNVHPYTEVATGPRGEVLVIDEGGGLVQVDGDRLSGVSGPDGRVLDGVRSAVFGQDGTLWLARETEMLVRRGGDWAEVVLPGGAGPLRRVTAAADGGAYLTCRRGIIRIAPGLAAGMMFERDGLSSILELEDGSVAVLDGGPRRLAALRMLQHGQLEELLAIDARPRDLARRGSTLVASFDRYLVMLAPGAPATIIGPRDGLSSGGDLLVDSEGSLWVGTIEGLIQYPEPETASFGEADGVPSSHARFVSRNDEGIWVTTWQGLALIEESPRGWVVTPYPGRGIGIGCVDAAGAAWGQLIDWLAPTFTMLERRDGRDTAHRVPGFKWIESCAPAPDGGLWMAGNLGLLRSSQGGGVPRLVPNTPVGPDGDPSVRNVLEDSAGRLWISRDRMICHAPADQVMKGLKPVWDCQTPDGFRHTDGFAETSEGSIWAAATGGGVLRFRDGTWEAVPGSLNLGSLEMAVRPAAGGDVWVLGHDVSIRVTDRPDLPEGWLVLERLSAWHGLPQGVRKDILEEEDGTLWVTTGLGAVRVPARARSVPRTPPKVHLTELLLDGRQLPHEPRLLLASNRNRLELHFSALSFRDPGLLRYRIRTGSSGDPQPLGQPSVRLADLAPGDHSVEVTASLDGVSWSPDPARLGFRVAFPWYLQAWFLALSAVVLAGAIYAVHRARISSLMRLERQRVRIAMDLHDEMGSGLGSIGILAGLAAGDRLGEDRRRAVSTQIAKTAGELGTALDEIVWSLRPGSDSIESLAVELAERGRRMFPDGQTFRTVFPDRWPLVRLEPAVRRNLQRIAVEALHNAARHAQARSVTLALEPLGRRWRLKVQDDGSGLPPGAESGGDGLGLRSIRERAAQIGAVVEWLSPPGGGTALSLEFDPQSEARGTTT